MGEPSEMAIVPTRGFEPPEPPEPYLSRWGLHAEQRRWALQAAVVTIGREASADVVIDGDLLVSRLHSTLERVAGAWTIVDNGLSRNGTFVNGRRVSGRVQLHDRDQIRIGSTVLTFCAPAEIDGLHTLVGDPLPTAARLTPAQRAVLIALCRPYKDERAYATPATNQQIADELFLSLDAVKTHLRALFHKLGIDHLPQTRNEHTWSRWRCATDWCQPTTCEGRAQAHKLAPARVGGHHTLGGCCRVADRASVEHTGHAARGGENDDSHPDP